MKAIFKNQLLTVFALCAILTTSFYGCKKDDDEPVDNMKRVTVTLSGAQETPAITSSGTGSAKLIFDPVLKTINYNMTWTLGSSSATTANMHFHGAEDGSDLKNSAVVFGITGFTTANTGTISGTTIALTDVQVAQLLAGKWYLNIHSSTVTSGELRGNIKF
ncbi:CHRD domain-containing protein [Daejeonella sp.]|uniref:CHRD domain-containing protein n=1 Tax=Daejeonella sp. TaxID=2805397 RepID=UPI0030C161BD